MKVLIISSDINFFKEGRISDVLERHLAYARALEKLLVVVKTAGRDHYQPLIKNNLVVVPSGGRGNFNILKNLYKKSVQLISQEKIDLVNAQDPMIYGLIGYLLKRKFKIPLIVNWHGDFLDNPYWLKARKINFLLLRLAKFLVKKAGLIRVVSPLIKTKLERIGIKSEKIRVIPTPVDLEKFSRPDKVHLSALQRKYDGKKVILFVGRLEKVKNLTFCFEGFKRLLEKIPAAQLLIIGDGSQLTALKKFSQNLDLTKPVEFLGARGHRELVSYYHLAKVAVLPSISESFGKVILEAAASGLPTLASKTTGATSIIKDERLLFEIDDNQEFLDKITALLTDENLRQALADNLKKDVQENYGWQKSVDKIIAMWQEVINIRSS